MNIYVAIDPGVSGGIAYSVGGFVSVRPMPDPGDLVKFLRAIAAEVAQGTQGRAVMEEVGGYIGEAQPASSAFKFGMGYGFILGALQTLEFRIELVRPQAWQKIFALGKIDRTFCPKGASDEQKKAVRVANGRAKLEWKRKLKDKAQQLFPGIDVTLKTCDALLLLEYARRTQP